MNISINSERLKCNMEELASIGLDTSGGISRPSFSPDDMAAREWLKEKIQSAGLEFRQDGAGNIFGRIDREGKTVMAGSHIDTVINGGMYDGSIGVLAALECLLRIKEEGWAHSKPLEVAAFTDEEGNLVGDYLGSRAFIGGLDRTVLEEGLTQFGQSLNELLEGTEFSIDSIMEAHQDRPEIDSFLEIHLEQGPVLETEEKTIGIVDRIAGKNYWHCYFLGRASHAGTTPFELRQDAFLGLADFALKGTHYVATKHPGSKMTIGRIHAHPGAFSIVPGRVDFTLDFRSTEGKSLRSIAEQLPLIAEEVAAIRGLQFSFQSIDETIPIPTPERINLIMEEECQKLGYSHMRLPSGAGHDAQILAEVTDSSMIFIPCEDGISHSPEEKVKWEDLEAGTTLLLHTLLRLAG